MRLRWTESTYVARMFSFKGRIDEKHVIFVNIRSPRLRERPETETSSING
jgi:hypothetical protein